MLPLMVGSYSATVIVPTVFLFICSLHHLSLASCSSRNRQGTRFASNTACRLSPAFRPRFSHSTYTKRLITVSLLLPPILLERRISFLPGVLKRQCITDHSHTHV